MDNYSDDKISFNAADIKRYLHGQMSAREMYALEKAAIEDPFLADAIAGYSYKKDRGEMDTQSDLDSLRAQLKKRVESPQQNDVPVYQMRWWRIAVMVLLFAGSGGIIYYLSIITGPNKAEIARVTEQDEKTGTTDSITAAIPRTPIIQDTTALTANSPEPPQSIISPKKMEDTPGVSSGVVDKASAAPEVAAAAQSPALTTAPNDSIKELASVSGNEKKENNQFKDVMASRKMEILDRSKNVNEFSGKVVNQDNQPVPNAAVSVNLLKSDTTYLTDSRGYFKLYSPDTTAAVVINREGFEPARVTLQRDNAKNEVRLRTIDQPVNAVVPGLGASKNQSEAEPVIGLEAYNRYIDSNKKLPGPLNDIHGDVTVSFIIDKEGKPGSFKIVKSLSALIDEEAIRLIKDGSRWNVLNGQQTSASFTVHF